MVAAALLGVAVSSTPKAQAANLYWDNDTSVAGTGGSGSWSDDKSSNWSGSSVGDTAASAGTFSSADIAYFTGTAGTATLAGPITIGGLVFSGADFTVTGDTLTLAAASGAPTISVSISNVATLSSIVAGASGLTKSGLGTLRLTNASNSYTGVTTISNGVLVIASAGAIGSDASAISILNVNPVPSSTNLTGFGGGSLVLDGSASGFSLARNINFDGRGPVGDKASAILSIGDNTLSGTLTSAVNALSPATSRNSRINSVNGTLTLSGTLVSQGTATTTFLSLGGLNTAGVGNFNLTGILSGSGSIEKSGGGTLFLNPSLATSFTGTVRIGLSATGQQSSIRVTSTGVFGANTGTNANAAIDMNGGLLELLSAGDLNFNSLASGKNVYLRANSTFYTGPAAGGATINRLATFGTFRVAANTTGTFNSRNGYGMAFQAWTPESSNNPNTITNNMGGTLTFAAGVWGNTDATARTLTFGGSGNTYVTGSVTASAALHVLTKSGAGLLTVVGTASTYTGNTNITAGAIQITDFRSLGTTSSIVLGNATSTAGNLIIGTTATPTTAGLSTLKTITLNTTTGSNSIYANQTLASPVILGGAITKIAAATTGALILGGTSTQDNIINVVIPVETTPSTGGVTKLGTGTWVLNAANTYLGATTIQGGTLKLRATAASSDVIKGGVVIFSADTVTQTAGGTLEFKGFLSTDTTETLGALTPTTGMGNVRVVSDGALTTLTFASMGTRAAGTGLNFTNPTSGSIVFTAAVAGTNGIVGGFATVGGVNFVSSIAAGGAVTAPTYTAGGASFDSTIPATIGAATKNYFSNGSAATTGPFAANSLKLTNNGSGGAFTGDGLLTITTTSTATSLGGILFDNSGGAGSISGYTGIFLSGTTKEYIFTVGGSTPANEFSVSSPLTAGAANFTKNGPGVLVLSGTSVFTGNAVINEGTVKLSGGTVTFGTNSTAANITTLRQGATLDINAAGASQTIGVGALQGAGTVTNSGGGTSTAGNISFGIAASTGTTAFTGILQNGAGVLNVIIDGTIARTQSLLGQSTYTGVTTIATGAQVTVNVLANGGVASGIGQSTSAAANLVFSGSAPTLIYQGNNRVGSLNLGSNSASTDRLFTISGAAAVLSSTVTNANAIVWSNTGAIAHGTVAARTLTLTGTSTGDNTFAPQLTDSGTGTDITSLTKTGVGQWNLAGTSNSYTGATTVNDGILGLNAVGVLPSTSPLALTPTSATSVATLQMSGEFTHSLAASATAGSGTVTFGFSLASTTGGVGFAAHSTPLVVALGGTSSPTALTWGSGGFVGTGGVQNLAFSSTSALSSVDFRNAIDLGALVRTINVLDNTNTGADFATMSGVLSGTSGGLLKIGAGILRLTGLNSYTGTTSVEAGTLVVSSLGGSTGAATTSVGAGAVTMDNANAIVLGNATTGGGILQYVGPGETSDRKIRLRGTTAGNQIHADGTGSLVLSNVAHDTTETGNKTLSLRGSSAFTNFITSQLSNNVAGVLSVGVDGGTAWVLTNSTNSYTGTTTVSAGALGIGHNSAIPAALTISNGNVFAHGDDRALSVTLTFANNTSNGFYGDYSLTFNGTNTLAAAASNVNVFNSVVAGKSVTLNGMSANSLTANRAWAIEGSGETVLNGNFTTSTAFGVRIDKGGDGTLVLGTSGANSNWNQSITAIDVDRGTLRFSASEAIPSFGAATPTGSAAATSAVYTVSSTSGLTVGQQFTGTNVPAGSRIVSLDSATTFTASVPTITAVDLNTTLTFVASGGLTISPDVATTDTATVDLNGTDQTINALTASTDGTVIIDNTSSSAAAFSFGAKDTAVAFGTGTGNYSIQNTGVGPLSIVKLGNTTVSFGASVPVGNKGTIASYGGSFTIAGQVTAVSRLDVVGNSTLALTGELTNPGLITLLNVNGGSTLSLLNGAGTPLNLTWLELGAGTGTATLNLNVGESATDTITLLAGGTKTLANTITFNLTDAGLAGSTTYTILSLVDGGLTAFGGSTNLLAGGAPGGFTSMTWGFTDTAVTLTTGTLITGDLYWRGTTGTTWNTNLNNWSTDKPGTITPVSAPGAGTNVIFAWNDAAASALTTTLEQNFKINKLVFEAGTTTPTSVTISPGAVLTNRLEIAPQTSTDGIEMQSAGPAAVTIGANLRLGANQTWNVASSAGVLTLVGSLLGPSNVTVSGAGKVTLSAVADPSFNPGDTVTFTVAGGTLELTNSAALGTTAAGNLASLVLSGGAFYYNNAATATLAHPITLSGGTLSGGGNNQTFSGAVSVTAASFVNMADLNGLSTAAAARNITLSGAVTGSGAVTIDSNDTATSGNQTNGNFVLNNAASTWNGALNLIRGNAFFQNVAAGGTATAYVGFDGIINFNQFGRVTYRNVNGASFTRTAAINFAAGAMGELRPDNLSTTLAENYTLTQSGALNLNAGSIARFALGDAASNLVLSGGVVLNGIASFGVNSGDADSLVTISGIGISGTGTLNINDEAGVWTTTSTRLAINAASTFIGDTTLTEGFLILGHKDALSAGSLTILGASTLEASTNLSASGSGPVPNAVILASTLTVSLSNDLSLSGILSGSGALTKTGSGTLTLNASNPNFSGAISLEPTSGANRGVIVANASSALGTGAVRATFLIGATGAQVQLNNGITLANAFTTTGAGAAGGLSGIIRSVTGANVLTGNVILTGGGGSSTYRADSGASLAFNGNIGADTNTSRYIILVGAGDFSFGAGGSIVPTLTTTGTTGLWSTNTGTTTINSTANTYALVTAIGAGNTLVVANLSNGGVAGSLGAAAVTATNLLLDGGTLKYSGSGAQSTDRLFSIGSADNSGGGATLDASGATSADTMSFVGAGAIGFNGISGAGTSGAETGVRTLTLTGTNTGANTLTSIISDQAASTGVTSVTKSGVGTWVINGVNTYTGATSITGGTLATSGDARLASTSGVTVGSTTTLSLGGNETINSLTNSGTVTIASGKTLTTGSSSYSLAGIVTGDGSLTKAGAGILTLSSGGTFSYAGLSTVSNGTLAFGADDQLGNSNAITVSGGVLDFGGFSDTVGVVTLSSGSITSTTGVLTATSLTADTATTAALSAKLGGATTLAMTGVGVLTLSGDNSFTGGTTVSAGTVRAGHDNAFGSLATDLLALNGGTLTSDGATARALANNVTLGGNVTLGATTTNTGALTFNGTVGLGAAVRTLTVDSNVTFAGIISDGGLTKAGDGILTLSGINTFTLGTTITNGTITIGHASSLGAGTVNVASGATLNLASFNVSNTITTVAGSTVTGGSLSAATAPTVGTVASVLTGTGATLTKTDGGRLTLTGANTYTGATTLSAGTIAVPGFGDGIAASPIGITDPDLPANLVISSGAKLEFTGGTATSTTRSFTVGGTAGIVAGTGAGTLEFTSTSKLATTGTDPALTLTANNVGSNRFDGILASGSNPLGNLTIDGIGTWVIGGNANRFRSDILIEAFAGATLGFESGSLGMGSGYSTSVIQISHNAVLVWSGANTDDISSRLRIPTGATAKMNLGSNNVEFATAPKNATGAAITNGTIQKSGAGTLKIATTVSSPGLNFDVPTGKLTINGTVGNVSLASGSTLGGSGFVGAVTAASNSTIGPGNSPGTLTASTLAMFGGSNFEWQVQDATNHSTGYDKLAISGSLDLTGASATNKINFKISSLLGNGDGTTLGNPLNFGPPAGVSSIRTFTFATVQTGANGVLLNAGENISDVFQFDVTQFTYTGSGLSNAGLWSIDWNSATGAITLTAVPEPSTYGFGLGALALAAAAIRRRKRQAKA